MKETMKVLFLNDTIIIMYKGHKLVEAKGTKRDVKRLMAIAQENLQSLHG